MTSKTPFWINNMMIISNDIIENKNSSFIRSTFILFAENNRSECILISGIYYNYYYKLVKKQIFNNRRYQIYIKCLLNLNEMRSLNYKL